MNKKCKHCLGKGYQYDVANMTEVPCHYCSHIRIEDIKVESSKPKRVVSREGVNIEHFKTLRDEFAIATFTVLLANTDLVPIDTNPCKVAYSYADDLMEARER